MALALLSMLFATVAGVITGGAIFLVARAMRHPIIGAISGVLVAGVTFFLLLPSTLIWLVNTTTFTKIDAGKNEAASVLGFVGLPEKRVSDFCYQISTRSVSPRADFAMAEADFKQWMKSQGWQPQEFCIDISPLVELKRKNPQDNGATVIETTVYPLRGANSSTGKVVKHGYCVYQCDRDSIIKIIYDLDAQRVYFEHAVL